MSNNPNIEALIIYFLVGGEVFKAQELIDDYQIKSVTFNNLSVAEDGVLCYDVIINHIIKPVSKVEFVNINFIVSPTDKKLY